MALLTVQQNLQQDAVASIDAAKVLIDKVLAVMEIFSTLPSLPIPYAVNAQQLLMFLLEHLDVTYDELLEFLTRFITIIVPALEVSTKAILLTNLKKMVSCSCDPRIPEKYRKGHKVSNDGGTSQEHGINIGLESIDFYNKLLVSPLSDEGKNWYFGLDNVKDAYKFARAEDFDAFLWFVMHKGRFPSSSDFSTISEKASGATILDKVIVTYGGGTDSSHILPGNTFTSSTSSSLVSLCIDAAYNEKKEIKENTLVPVSDDWNSVNWYMRHGDVLKNITSTTKNRDYGKERAICNIQFLDQSSSDEDSPRNGLVNNRFRFTILPKAYIHIPNLGAGEPPWRFIKLTFDSKGNYDKNGKYTINASDSDERYEGDFCIIKGIVSINLKSGTVTVLENKKSELIKNLKECYNGLTVYEFNYDYVMSMKLFDAKTITATLLNSLKNIRLGLGLDMGWEHTETTQKIVEIVKNIIENDDVNVDDCFFEFSNDKYDALLKNTDRIRAQKKDFSDVSAILNEYKDDAELNEQRDIIKRAITQTTAKITEGVEPMDEYKVRLNLITDMISQLSTVLVTSILSPKVLMLLEVNETLMGGKWEKLTFQDLMKAMREVIISIVKEVRDLIFAELLKLIISKLQPIIITINSAIVREQIENYTEILDDIMRHLDRDKIGYINTLLSLFKTTELNTTLDTVDYADIDASVTNKEEKLPINNC